MPLIFLLLAAVLAFPSELNMSYSGFRVVKNCKSIIKDNIKLLEEIKLYHMPIPNMSEKKVNVLK